VPVMTNSRAVLILMLVCLAGFLACSNKIDPSQIAGRYEARHQNGSETLDLRSDGTYTHEFIGANGTKSMSSNKWRFEPFEGEAKVALYDFTPEFPKSQRGDIVLLGVEKTWGRLRLYRSYDLDQYYVRN
jgi:hypothetical protein